MLSEFTLAISTPAWSCLNSLEKWLKVSKAFTYNGCLVPKCSLQNIQYTRSLLKLRCIYTVTISKINCIWRHYWPYIWHNLIWCLLMKTLIPNNVICLLFTFTDWSSYFKLLWFCRLFNISYTSTYLACCTASIAKVSALFISHLEQ